MRLELRPVDHDPVRFTGLARQFRKNAVEHAHTAPANESALDRLVRSVSSGRITPPQIVLDDEDHRQHN